MQIESDAKQNSYSDLFNSFICQITSSLLDPCSEITSNLDYNSTLSIRLSENVCPIFFFIRLQLRHIRSVHNKVLMIKITLFPWKGGVVRLVLLLHIGSTSLLSTEYFSVCMYTFASSSHVFSVVVRKYGLFNGNIYCYSRLEL